LRRDPTLLDVRHLSDRVLGVAAMLGGIGLLAWVTRTTGWGPPGSTGYVAYELANRLFALALVAVGTSLYAVHRAHGSRQARQTGWPMRVVLVGVGLMLVGNVVEFWFLSRAPAWRC
jgi:hypothetical protein